jgi:hypothetical protein
LSAVSLDEKEATRLAARMLACPSPTTGPLGDTSWKTRDDALEECCARLDPSADGAKQQAMLVQFTPAVIEQVVNRMEDTTDEAARRARPVFLRLLIMLRSSGGDSYSKPLFLAFFPSVSRSCTNMPHLLSTTSQVNLCQPALYICCRVW